jgi:hypothetical protein
VYFNHLHVFFNKDRKITSLNLKGVVADDPAPFIDGVRINSPHYLCKLLVSENSARCYTLVVSQYEKTNTIFYTLRAYATCPFSLAKIGSPYQHTRKVSLMKNCFHYYTSRDICQNELFIVVSFDT